jgi:hypothetical protein
MTFADYIALPEDVRERIKQARAKCVSWLTSRCAPACTNCVPWDCPLPGRVVSPFPERKDD